MNAARRFRKLLGAPGPIIAPGVYDCISAKVTERAGFPAAFISGGAVTASVLGYPDVGLQTMPEFLSQARNMARSVDIPLLVDVCLFFGGVKRFKGLGWLHNHRAAPSAADKTFTFQDTKVASDGHF